jgi:hypothetical protein
MIERNPSIGLLVRQIKFGGSMNEYKISIPIVLSYRRCKLLYNHIIVEVSLNNGKILYRGLDYFPKEERSIIKKNIIKKIRLCGQANTIKDRDYINFFKHFAK